MITPDITITHSGTSRLIYGNSSVGAAWLELNFAGVNDADGIFVCSKPQAEQIAECARGADITVRTFIASAEGIT